MEKDYLEGLAWVVHQAVKEYQAIGKNHDSLFYAVIIEQAIKTYDAYYQRYGKKAEALAYQTMQKYLRSMQTFVH